MGTGQQEAVVAPVVIPGAGLQEEVDNPLLCVLHTMDPQLQEKITMTLIDQVGVPLLKRAGPVWSWIRETVFRRPLPTPAPPLPVDFSRSIRLRLREPDAITFDLHTVPSVRIDFEVINRSDVDLVLDRIVLTLWNGQPVLQGVMAHRYPIPPNETTSTIFFAGMLTEGAAALIRKNQDAIRSGSGTATSNQLQVGARAYFDAPTLGQSFALEGWNLIRPLVGS